MLLEEKKYINEEHMGDHGNELNKCKINAEIISQKLLLIFLNIQLDFYLNNEDN